MNEMNGYTLSRQFFDWAFENPRENNPTMVAIYFFIAEVSNRLGWKKEFSITPRECMEAVSISSYNTYKKNFDSLVKNGFIEIIRKSTNQYQANIIALSNNDKADNKALDKALINSKTALSNNDKADNKALDKASIEQIAKHSESTCDIHKQQTINHKQQTTNHKQPFEVFWDLYDKKVGKKEKVRKKWDSLSLDTQKEILEYLPKYKEAEPNKQFRKNPETFFNNESWNDEIIEKGGDNAKQFTKSSNDSKGADRKAEILRRASQAVANSDSNN